MSDNTISIPIWRYVQLLRAEHDANHLKALIQDKIDTYSEISRDELKLIRTMFFGKEEEEE